MRSIEELIELFPDKTGKELLEIREQDRLEDKLRHQKDNESNLKWIENINVNGGYFRGVFSNQIYYYKINYCEMTTKDIMCEFESIVVYLCFEGGVIKPEVTSIQKQKERPQLKSNLGLDYCDMVTESDWNSINSHLHGITKFWDGLL